MISKNKKAQKGPTWLEVGLGAMLSVILGVVLGVLYLVTKPVQNVKDIPKDSPSGAVYYIEGAKGYGKSAGLAGKRRDFVNGESISVDEGELNAYIASTAKAPPSSAKPGDKAPPPDQKAIDFGTINVRIHAGKIQFASSVSYNILTVTGSIIVQASGTFERHGSVFRFDPEVIYVGGCPAQRLLLVNDLILSKLLFVQPIPDDIAAAWSKLSDVVLEGSTLRLKAP